MSWKRDPTRSEQVSAGLYHVVLSLSCVCSNQPCFIVYISNHNFLLVFNSLLWQRASDLCTFGCLNYVYFHFQFRITIWRKHDKVIIDSGEIKDPDIQGGKLGVMSFSQEKCMWSAVSTRCLGKRIFCAPLCTVAGIVFATLQKILSEQFVHTWTETNHYIELLTTWRLTPPQLNCRALFAEIKRA